mmetsp:Transcript_8840/g.23201  ORF Transcript_8840/g.23201 Transcript_8840/m.23201 type:complete len:440 (-) Transcript_8840:31-1350(-)
MEIRNGCLRPAWWQALMAAVAAVVLSVAPWLAAVVAVSLVWDALLWKPAWRSRPGRALWALIERASTAAAPHLLQDTRDAMLLPIVFPLVVYPTVLFAACAHLQPRDAPFSLPLMFAYHVLRMGPYFRFFAHACVMIHKEGHFARGLFKYGALNRVLEWYVAFYYGHVPESYRLGHTGIHHGHNNDYADVTTTLPFDRSRPWNYVLYVGEFFLYWSGLSVALYYWRKKDFDRCARMLQGTFAFYGVGVALAVLDYRIALGYFLLAHFEVMVYMSAMNYVWHAFVDPADPDNEYIHSITILDGQYKVLNEDYHVVHHLKPSLHWSLMEDEYLNNVDEYRRNRATIFRDTHEFELFFWILFKRFDLLAEHFVDLDDKMTYEQKLALVMYRLQPIDRAGPLATHNAPRPNAAATPPVDNALAKRPSSPISDSEPPVALKKEL